MRDIGPDRILDFLYSRISDEIGISIFGLHLFASSAILRRAVGILIMEIEFFRLGFCMNL